MKSKLFSLLSSFAGAAILSAVSANAATYSGNGASGFGGGVGNSVLTVTSSGPNINFSITSVSTSFSGNRLVLYFDSKSGGSASTTSFTDYGDQSRVAVSGATATSRSVASFPAGFGADFGISVNIGDFAALFDLSTSPSFTFVPSGPIAGSGLGPITFSIPFTALGLPASGGNFQFVGTLISNNAFRSNETIGASVTAAAPANPGDAPNAGFNGTTTFSAANLFVVPEPGSSMLAGLALLGLLRRRR